MNITIVRNTTQILSFTATGDYSGDTVKFTLKADKTLTSARVIDEAASVSYSSPTSTITVALTPSDSASLSNDTYYYDLRVENSSTDRESLESGIVYIDKSVRNDTDGASVTSTSNVTTLTGADFDANDTLVSDGTDFIGKSVSEMKTLLGMPKFATFTIQSYYLLGSLYHEKTEQYNYTEKTFAYQRMSTGVHRLSIDAGSFLTGETHLVINDTSSLPTGWYTEKVWSASQLTINLYNDSDVLSDLSDSTKVLRFTIMAVTE